MKAYNMELQKELTSRRIRFNTGSDVLRWGYTLKGIYTTKEAYQLMFQTQESTDSTWNRICTTGIWPKVSTFIWLLYHQRILTWDNLIKEDFKDHPTIPTIKTMKKLFNTSWTLSTWPINFGKSSLSDVSDLVDF